MTNPTFSPLFPVVSNPLLGSSDPRVTTLGGDYLGGTITGSYAQYSGIFAFSNNEYQTALLSLHSNREELLKLFLLLPWRDLLLSVVSDDLDREIEEFVVREYALLPEVAMIYADKLLLEKIFTVYINKQKYDDKLMDSLLNKEYKVLESFS